MTVRPFLVVAHTGRPESLEATRLACELLTAGGATVVCLDNQRDEFAALTSVAPLILGDDIAPTDVEMAIILGGDGTILRTAEIMRGSAAPLLGVNLGHVGFLAELEPENLADTIARCLAREYTVEERMTMDVDVIRDGEVVYSTWALNEASVEKTARERMIEVVISIDSRPLSTFGCDGVLMATPTGSTAYSFSAGGPVVWPEVEALIMVPLSAHALFARPFVVGPNSTLEVELLTRTAASGVLWCDGRRTFDLVPGSRVIARRSGVPVRLAHIHDGPFTDRLVKKFSLPVTGWRGGAESRD
ncbi:MAG: inorganic polyphosphate/ATP-NAD kinase [Actinomycetota bacterium]